MALLDFSTSPHGGRQRHLPEWESQPRITPTTIIDHSIVGSGESAFGLFRDRSGLESHFIVCGAGDLVDGEIWQLMDTGRQADANLDANAYAISIETGDRGDPDRQPWTQAQLESLAWLHEQLIRVHPIIPRRASSSCMLPGGLGYHTLLGAPSCWTPVVKTCPGTIRKQQWREVLLPAFLNPEENMTEAEIVAAVRKALNEPLLPDPKGGSLASKTIDIQGGVDRTEPAVANVQAILDAGLIVTLTAEQLQQLAATLAPLVADLLPHPTLQITGVAAPTPEPPA